MSNLYATSDTHFGHRNLIHCLSDWKDSSTCRDFPSIEEHDRFLLEQINRVVRPCDTLLHLGDFGFGFLGGRGKSLLTEYREKIQCERIILVLGNHDHAFEDEKSELRDLFAKVKHLHYFRTQGRYLVLCHYAMKIWPWQRYDAVHLYGHSHGRLPDDLESLSLDVGVDTELYGHRKYTPYSFEEIFHIMDNYKRREKCES